MSQIKQLLRLHTQGYSIKAIARTLNISKNTVKSYLAKLQSAALDPQELLQLEDPVLETRFHSGNPAYKDPRYIHFKGKLEYLSKELKKTGMTKKLLWDEYILGFPQGYAYSQFCFHLHQQLVARKPTSVLSHEPADKLFVDFAGKQISYTDRQITEALNRPDIGDIAYPKLLSSGDNKFLYQVWISLEDMIRISSTNYTLTTPDH